MSSEGLVRQAPTDATSADIHAPADNTAAEVQYIGVAGKNHEIDQGIAWSYDDDPTGGSLTITDGGTEVFKVYITNGGPGFIPYMKRFSQGATVIITLAAGGTGIAGTVNVLGHRV